MLLAAKAINVPSLYNTICLNKETHQIESILDIDICFIQYPMIMIRNNHNLILQSDLVIGVDISNLCALFLLTCYQYNCCSFLMTQYINSYLYLPCAQQRTI